MISRQWLQVHISFINDQHVISQRYKGRKTNVLAKHQHTLHFKDGTYLVGRRVYLLLSEV